MKDSDLLAGSQLKGHLPKGCVLCQKGAKLVLLVTGLCKQHCWYCPLSEEKRGRDLFFANERRCDSINEVLEEAEAMDALGTGITGGDPLEVVDRTVDFIKNLKRRFGKRHHIHLYTPSFDRNELERVVNAGLDELRFHPPASKWNETGLEPYMEAVRHFKNRVSVGFEIPAIPGYDKYMATLIKMAWKNGAAFVNLNELEFSPTNFENMKKMGVTSLDEFCTTARGSREVALAVLGRLDGISVHFCSAPYKDSVQLRKRLLRRGERMLKDYEELTEDGTIVLGIVPVKREEAETVIKILSLHDVDASLYCHVEKKNRLEVAAWVLEDIFPDIPQNCFIVEEYASHDRLEVERVPLG